MKGARKNSGIVVINNHVEFLEQIRKTARIYANGPLPYGRRCVIVRSHAAYGYPHSAIIEWEGSPPWDTVFVLGNRVHSIGGEKVRADYAWAVGSLLQDFLSKYPHNPDGSPIWLDAIPE